MASMSDVRLVAVNGNNEPRKYGYADGVGHGFLIPASFQGDPVAWLCEQSDAPAACGRAADGGRLVEKEPGDRMCARCCRVITDAMIADAVADRDAVPAEGESVAGMIMSDPSAVVIGLDVALAESEPVKADVVVSVADLAPGPERDASIHALWTSGGKGVLNGGKGAPKGAKNAGQGISRQSEWKSVKEVPEAVTCVSDASFTDRGDGTGTCRSCGWVGPVKEVEIAPAMKAERVWCSGGKSSADGCTACGRDVKVTRAGNMARHKTPGVEKAATYGLAMAAHWTHGRAPVNVITLLESEELRAPKRAPLAEAPATVDVGRKSADDVVGGAAAGMYRGHTSLTRGGDMTGAVPQERVEGGKPVPTTNDSKLGVGLRTDVSARTDKKIVATAEGAEVVSNVVGGEHGFMSSEEYEAMRGKPGFAAFKKSYWRKVRRVRLADERNRARKAASKGSKGKGKR